MSELMHRSTTIRHRATNLPVVGPAVIVSIFRFAIAEPERAAACVADHWNVFDRTEAHFTWYGV